MEVPNEVGSSSMEAKEGVRSPSQAHNEMIGWGRKRSISETGSDDNMEIRKRRIHEDNDNGEMKTLTMNFSGMNLLQEIQIFVKTQNGTTITLDVRPSETIANLKAKLANKVGINPEWQKLIFAGRLLQSQHTLVDCKITKESTVHLGLISCKAKQHRNFKLIFD